MRTSGLLLLTIIAITAGTAYYLPSSTPVATKSGRPADDGFTPMLATPHNDAKRDVLTLLAEYFGLDIGQERFETELRKVARICGVESAETCFQKASLLGDICSLDFGLEPRPTACPAKESPDPVEPLQAKRLAAEVGTYLGTTAGSPNLSVFRSLDRTPAIVRELKRYAKNDRATASVSADVHFLIATLPDYVDSHMRWDFDAMMAALQAGANYGGFVLDRFYIPDWDPSRDLDAPTHAFLTDHETAPAVVLFRSEDSLLVVSVIGETPTSGIHKRAFLSAARIAWMWNANEDQPINVLGPMYSGSRESVRAAIRTFREDYDLGETVAFELVSGSATAGSNKTFFGNLRNVAFSATVLPDNQLECALLAYAHSTWGTQKVARLLESNTGWGAAQSTNQCALRSIVDYIDIPFPLHISRVGSESADGMTPSAQPSTRFMNLSFLEPQATDQIPILTPRTTLPSIELIMAHLLYEIHRERVAVIMITATDARDRLFLAHQIRSRVPDVQIMTIEADLLYSHPSYASDLQGMLVSSSYPLFTATQHWKGLDRRLLFRSMSAEGVYNAMVALVAKPGTALLDYRSAVDPSKDFPDVWISVVGRDGLWPVQQTAAEDTDYLFRWLSLRYPDNTTVPEIVVQPSVPILVLLATIVVFPLVIGLMFFDVKATLWPRLWSHINMNVEDGRHRFLLCFFVTASLLQGFACALCMGAFRVQWAYHRFRAVPMAVAAAITMSCVVFNAVAAITVARNGWRRFQSWSVVERVAAWTLGGAVVVGLSRYCLEAIWFDTAHPASPLLLVTRVIHPSNGVSPAVPLVAIAAALFLWSMLNLRRVGMPRPEQITGALELIRNLTLLNDAPDAGGPSKTSARQDLALVQSLVLVFVVAVFVLFAFPRSHEGPWFDAVYLCGTVVVYGLALSVLVRQMKLWRELRELLEALSWHPIMNAFKRLPRGMFKSRLTTDAPALVDLGPLVYRCQEYVPLAEWTPVADCRIDGLDGSGPLSIAERLRHQPEFRQDPGETTNQIFAAEQAVHAKDDTWVAWRETDTWQAIQPEILRLAATLRKPWRAGWVPQPLWAAEESVAIVAGLAIREILARLANAAMFVMGSLFLMLASHSFFPFYPRQRMLAISWLFILSAIVVSLRIFSGIDRDQALSVMTGTKPGRINWDSTTISRLLVYGVVPLASLVAVQFPEIGDTILQWIQPVQHALP